MYDCKPLPNLKLTCNVDASLVDLTLYMQLIASLMYPVNTRSNICCVVNNFSQFMVTPCLTHWVVGKHMLRYSKGLVNYHMRYTIDKGLPLHGFCDLD
jgi:hypothetical protein